jgi:hypothetical protein
MEENSAPSTVGTDDPAITRVFRRQMKVRVYRLLNYFALFIFLILVNGGLLGTDYILFSMVDWVFHDDVQKYPVLAMWFDYVKIALAFFVLITVVVHGVLSMITQVRIDLMISRELDRP